MVKTLKTEMTIPQRFQTNFHLLTCCSIPPAGIHKTRKSKCILFLKKIFSSGAMKIILLWREGLQGQKIDRRVIKKKHDQKYLSKVLNMSPLLLGPKSHLSLCFGPVCQESNFCKAFVLSNSWFKSSRCADFWPRHWGMNWKDST